MFNPVCYGTTFYHRINSTFSSWHLSFLFPEEIIGSQVYVSLRFVRPSL